jgi:hypothetical protein
LIALIHQSKVGIARTLREGIAASESLQKQHACLSDVLSAMRWFAVDRKGDKV